MTIQPATENDIDEIQRLVYESVGPYPHPDFDENGWRIFIAYNSRDSIQARISNASYLTLCFLQSGRIVGIITIQDGEKIDQLFVLPDSKNMGIARELWRVTREQYYPKSTKFWVKASTQAVPVYQSFGFQQEGGCQTSNGISFYRMTLEARRQ